MTTTPNELHRTAAAEASSPTSAYVDPAKGRWLPTAAHFRATFAALGMALVAVLARRPDLLVLAAPLAAVVVWSLVRRPVAAPQVHDRLSHSALREGEATLWRAEMTGLDDVDLVTAELVDAPWIQRRPRHGALTASVGDSADAAAVELAVALRSTRWGRRVIPPARISAVGPWGSFRWVDSTTPQFLTTLPLPAQFDSNASVRPSDGLVGLYRSVRPGEGSEFASIRAFQFGDRMRRINWPRSTRAGALHVNATSADQDTHVVLIVDVESDFGISGGIDGPASSLDSTVRAAGAIAEHYALSGDRVSLRSIGATPPVRIPPGSGPAHLRRLLDTLSVVRAGGGLQASSRRTYRHELAATGAELTVMLSPLITSEALDAAVDMGRHGQSVVVIDTLPSDIVVNDHQASNLAWRIRLLERRRELRAVQHVGIPVIQWLGPGSLDQFLRDATRRSASAPRLRQR